MIEMIPDVISSEIKSSAEKKLFREFKTTVIDGKYTILHSLGLADHVTNVFGEIDFVVICNSGILCVEVKGGEVKREKGIWSFTNKYGKSDSSSTGPFQQVTNNSLSLRNYLKKRLKSNDPIAVCQFSSCVVMPDCKFDYSGIDIIPEILFDKRSYKGLKCMVENSFLYWKDVLHDKHGFRGGTLSDADIDRAAKLLRGDFRFVPVMKDLVEGSARELCRLTEEQYSILEALSDNNRVLISGFAGSGKTLLAMEQCRRLDSEGKKVLYLCFNKNIAEYVSYQFKREKYDVKAVTLHSLMMNGKQPERTDQDYFEKQLPELFMKQPETEEYDWLVIDEGQDLFRDAYVPCISKLVKNGIQNGNWIVFYDYNQNIFNTNSQFIECLNTFSKTGAVKYKLTVNCRNTRLISDANYLMTGISELGKSRVDGMKVDYRKYKTKTDEHKILDDIVLSLLNEGMRGDDIIILSRYSIKNPANCLHGNPVTRTAGRMKLKDQMWKAAKNEIRFSTISAFKGLESKVVIMIDVDGFEDQASRIINYVGVSRAISLLYVLYPDEKEQERQNMAIRTLTGKG